MNPVEHNPAMHPVEPEEVMALRDGELEPEAAARVEAHLRDCAECRKLAGEMNVVSEQVLKWGVEACPQNVATATTSPSAAKAPRLSVLTAPLGIGKMTRSQFWMASLATAAGLLLIVAISIPNLLRSGAVATSRGNVNLDEKTSSAWATIQATPPPPPATQVSDGPRDSNALSSLNDKHSFNLGGYIGPREKERASGNRQFLDPMVIRTVSLVVLAEDYAKARASVDRIVAAHGGFAAQLTATDRKGAAQSLTATLRVPADKLAAALVELKKLGRVEQESHDGQEVTQQYTDLNARLANARNTEQRLIAVLQQRTGKVADILEVEQEIARVREQIEVMDAQRRTMENQVQLATIHLQLREDYKASLELAPPTLGTRLWNAFVGGIGDASDTVLGFVLFLLNAGPTLLLWVAILFWPARAAWRRLRPTLAATA